MSIAESSAPTREKPCPWCSTVMAWEADHCPSCGKAQSLGASPVITTRDKVVVGLSVATALLLVAGAVWWLQGGGGGSYTREVSAADYAARRLKWPFTVASGRVGCERSFPYFESGGTRYALNGRARGLWPYVDPLLKVDGDSMRLIPAKNRGGHVVRIDPEDVRDEARALCDEEARDLRGSGE